MTGLYLTLIASLACGASAFLATPAMLPLAVGAALRRTSAAVLGGSSATSQRLLRGGVNISHASMAVEHFDYLVIGGGSGGVASARRAATYDVKVNSPRLDDPVCLFSVLSEISIGSISFTAPRRISEDRDTSLIAPLTLAAFLKASLPCFAGWRDRGGRNGRDLCKCRLCPEEGV